MHSYLFELRAQWGSRRESAEDCAWRLSRMLDNLSDVHRGFSRMIVDPDCARSRPPGPLPRLAAEIVSFFKPIRVYDSMSKRRSVEGYELHASAQRAKSRHLTMTIYAGRDGEALSAWLSGNWMCIVLNILDDGQDDAVAVPVAAIKPAFLAMIAAWQAERGRIASTRYGELQRDPGDAAPFVRGTWAAYSAPGARWEASPPPDTISMPMADSGTLLLATAEPLDLGNPTHLRAAAALDASLPQR